MPNPKVSFLVCAHNAESTIEESLLSVLEQDFSDYEVIFVDDGSGDSTLAIVERLGSEYSNLSIVKLGLNVGLTKALNIGLRHCSGEYVARHDADDISLPNRLVRQWKFAERHSADFLCSKFRQGYKISPKYFRSIVTPRALRFGNFLCHGTYFMKRSMLTSVGGYNEAWPVSQDFELILRLMSRGTRIYFHREVIYQLNRDFDSISTRKRGLQDQLARKALALYQNDSSFVSSPDVLHVALRSLGL